MDKKVWEKPQLVVLVRTHPEEKVLSFCKGGTIGTGNATSYANCEKNQAGCTSNCSVVQTS